MTTLLMDTYHCHHLYNNYCKYSLLYTRFNEIVHIYMSFAIDKLACQVCFKTLIQEKQIYF